MAKANFTSVSVDPLEREFAQAPVVAAARKPAASMKIKVVGGYWTAFVPSGQALMSFVSIEACLAFVQGFLVEVVS